MCTFACNIAFISTVVWVCFDANSAYSCTSFQYYFTHLDFPPGKQAKPTHHSFDGLRVIDGIKVGHTQTVELSPNEFLQMKTLSTRPKVFEIPGFLSRKDCAYVIDLAKRSGLRESKTSTVGEGNRFVLMDRNRNKQLDLDEMQLTLRNSYDLYVDHDDIKTMYKDLKIDLNGDNVIVPEEMRISPELMKEYLVQYVKTRPALKSRHSKQVWLFPDKDKDAVFKNIQYRVGNLTRLSQVFIQKSDFQIVNYDVNGHYNAHMDSSTVNKKIPCCHRNAAKHCRLCRFMTILFYLNDVPDGGGTAFPAAGNETWNSDLFVESGAIDLYHNCHMSSLVVKPEVGKAVMWYNHHVDPDTGWVGELDRFSWHGGCAVTKGQKWIANFWIKYTDNKDEFSQHIP